ncbi:MAG: ATP-binding cassette domain-containing protein, partial [Selenomonadaceae bacterium]
MLEVDIRVKRQGFSLEANFTAKKEVLGILGASGAGKSLTLKCIAGIETPDFGKIVLDGRVLFDSVGGINLPPQLRRVGYLFQDYALFPHMTVRENLAVG